MNFKVYCTHLPTSLTLIRPGFLRSLKTGEGTVPAIPFKNDIFVTRKRVPLKVLNTGSTGTLLLTFDVYPETYMPTPSKKSITNRCCKARSMLP